MKIIRKPIFPTEMRIDQNRALNFFYIKSTTYQATILHTYVPIMIRGTQIFYITTFIK